MVQRMLMKGIGSSPGKTTGKVKIILSKHDWPQFKQGNILVTHITDPTMVPLMAKAAGIICDIGGTMSHPSIVSRELGIPCVVGTKTATKILKNNQFIEMNGKTGEILDATQ